MVPHSTRNLSTRPNTTRRLAAVATLLATGLVACATGPQPEALPLQDTPSAPETLEVTSPDFNHGEQLGKRFEFNQFGCTGENFRPTLKWSNVPTGTKSFAVIVHDPDAPTGVGFFHWAASDIHADARGIAPGADAKEYHTDYGTAGYGGPCPPPGRVHRYVYTVYALDTAKLEVPPAATGALLRFVLSQHTLAFGRLVARYGRES